jgi:hypothetical protein
LVWRSSSYGSASYECGTCSSSFTSGQVSKLSFERARQRVELGCELVGMGKKVRVVYRAHFIGAW